MKTKLMQVFKQIGEDEPELYDFCLLARDSILDASDDDVAYLVVRLPLLEEDKFFNQFIDRTIKLIEGDK